MNPNPRSLFSISSHDFGRIFFYKIFSKSFSYKKITHSVPVGLVVKLAVVSPFSYSKGICKAAINSCLKYRKISKYRKKMGRKKMK